MSTEVIGSDWAGHVVDETFLLEQWLGGTESSGVFRTALPGADAEKAAIKLIPAEGAEAEERVAGWEAAGVAHPHLVRVFGTGRCEVGGAKFVYVVTEYAEQVLGQVLRERALTPEETRELLGPVVEALLFLHAKGFVHGHVKPSNLLAVGDKLKLSADGLLRAGMVRRRAAEAYGAPERGSGAVAPAEDAWALGVTLVEALTDRPPEWDRSATADPVVPEAMPQPFAEIARRCLRVDAAQRCTLDVVKALLDGETVPEAAIAAPASAEPIAEAAAAELAQEIAPLAMAVETAAAPIAQPTPLVVPPVPRMETAAAPLAAPATVRRVGQASRPRSALVPLLIGAVLAVLFVVALVVRSHKADAPVADQAASSEMGTAQGAIVKRVLPDVPGKASATIHGAVLLTVRVKVNGAGEVTDATLAAPGPSKYFARLAVESSRAWKFRPAQRGGRGVSSVWMLHYRFRADGIDVTPEQEVP